MGLNKDVLINLALKLKITVHERGGVRIAIDDIDYSDNHKVMQKWLPEDLSPDWIPISRVLDHVKSIHLRGRLMTFMRDHNIKSVDDLLIIWDDLLRFRNLGIKSIVELHFALAKYNIITILPKYGIVDREVKKFIEKHAFQIK